MAGDFLDQAEPAPTTRRALAREVQIERRKAMRVGARTSVAVVGGLFALTGVGCTSGSTITEVSSASSTTTAKPSDSSQAPQKSDTPATSSSKSSTTTSKADAATPKALVAAGLVRPDDVGARWEALDEPTEPSRPEAGERPVDCPFTNDFYEGAVLGATSAEFKNGEEKIYNSVMVFESEAAAKDAMKVRQRDQDEECTKTALEKSFESQGSTVVSFTQQSVTGPGYADEEVYTAFEFQVTKSATLLSGGTLYAASRVGRVVMVTNYKNTAGPVGDMPSFMADPIERLRKAGA